MNYIEKYRDAIISFNSYNPNAGWFPIDKHSTKNWYDFLEVLQVHRVFSLKQEELRAKEDRKKEIAHVPLIEKPIQDYLKCYNIVSNAYVEAQYLSETKPTKANKRYVEYAKEVLPILEMEMEYFERVLDFYFYAK